MGKLEDAEKLDYLMPAKILSNFVPRWDYHVHSNYSDGRNSIEEMILGAIKKQLTRMIFTEHTEPWLSTKDNWFSEYYKEISFYRDKYKGKIEVLIGIEAPAADLDEALEITSEMEKEAEFILGAAHRYPSLKKNSRVKDLVSEQAIEMEYETLLSLAQNKKIDAIAHLGGTCSKYVDEFPMDLAREVIRKATKNGIAIEINHVYHQPLKKFLSICVEENALVTLGSNAHSVDQLGIVSEALLANYNE